MTSNKEERFERVVEWEELNDNQWGTLLSFLMTGMLSLLFWIGFSLWDHSFFTGLHSYGFYLGIGFSLIAIFYRLYFKKTTFRKIKSKEVKQWNSKSKR